MKFVRFYLLTIIIARKSYAENLNTFTQNELKYLSRKLYPEECMDLVNYLTIPSYLETSYKFSQRTYDVAWIKKPQLVCLENLEEWNESNSKDRYSRNKLESILKKLGRPDLVTHLEKNFRRRQIDKVSKTNEDKRNVRQNRNLKAGMTELTFVYNEVFDLGPVKHQEKREESLFSELHFIFYVVVGSLVVLSFLGFTIFAFYDRACRYYHRCTNNFKNEDEEKCTVGKVLDEFEVKLCECCSAGGEGNRDGEKLTEFIAKFWKREEIGQAISKMKKVKKTRKRKKMRELERNVSCKCKLSKKRVRSGKKMIGRSTKLKNLFRSSKNSRRKIIRRA